MTVKCYREKLIFTNNKHQSNIRWYNEIGSEMMKRQQKRGVVVVTYSAIKIRDKFKKMVAKCKELCMKQLQGTGLTRFMDKQGPWFKTLYEWVKTRDSCQPEQAIEPSANMILNPNASCSSGSSASSAADVSLNSVRSMSDQEDDNVGEEQPALDNANAGLFVPLPAPTRGKKRKRLDTETICESFKAVSDQSTNRMIKFFEEENKKDREHEEKLFQMLLFPQQYLNNLSQVQGQAQNDN